jgi:hypothetical protein
VKPHGGEVNDGRRGVRGVGRALIAALMRPVLVVEHDELAQDGQQVPRVIDKYPVQTLPPDGTYPPFRARVCPRRSQRAAQSMPSLVNTSSNIAVYLASRSRIRNRNCPARSPRSSIRLRAC